MAARSDGVGWAPVRLAIVGAGAVAEHCHLPAARRCPEAEIVAIVDRNLPRARALAERFGVPEVTSDYQAIVGRVDGAIVALPHVLHAPVGIELLAQGIGVLIEKPLALTADEADRLIAAADAGGAALQAGYMFRYAEGPRLVHRILREGWLGQLQRASLESGFVYNWPVSSGFFFSREQAGGGVLIDTGSHKLDLLCWWLGDAVALDYADDARGGVEADCAASLTFEGPAGRVPVQVTLSRLRNLRNTVRFVGSAFTLEYDLSTPDIVRLWPSAWETGSPAFASGVGEARRQSWDDVYAAQLAAFGRAIGRGEPPAVSGTAVRPSVALIERCYASRQFVMYPWEQGAPGHFEVSRP